MCYSPLFGDCYLRDEIARELLESDDEAPEARRERADEHTGSSHSEPVAGDFDILTGGASGE